jgi:hypothetical protein
MSYHSIELEALTIDGVPVPLSGDDAVGIEIPEHYVMEDTVGVSTATMSESTDQRCTMTITFGARTIGADVLARIYEAQRARRLGPSGPFGVVQAVKSDGSTWTGLGAVDRPTSATLGSTAGTMVWTIKIPRASAAFAVGLAGRLAAQGSI